ncbi:MAG: peptide ABC transporter substrate-binding protein [Candidatus Doudnabacteria bacterium]|nr:peptide ABC transporter substrate-binding protein [Candidatus Doudnabacteria bacterium]
MNGYSYNPIPLLKQVSKGFKALKNFHLSDIRKVFSLMGKTEKIVVMTLALGALASLAVSARGFYIEQTKIIPAVGGSITEGFVGQPQYLNPILATSEVDQALTKLIFSGLYKYGSQGEIIPDLAEGMPQISEDQKSYTINIKPNAIWHNNQKLTADDIVFTVNILKNQDFKSPLRGFWQNTLVEKISENTIRFTTKDISGPFIHNLTLPIIPKNLWEKIDPASFLLSENNLKAIGSGPYAIVQINKLPSGKIESITLSSFSNYHSARANIETFSIKFYDSETDQLNALRGHEIDAAGIVPLFVEDISQISKNLKELHAAIPQYQIAYFNLNEGLTSQDFIRSALTLATDRESLIKEAFNSGKQAPEDPLTKKTLSSTYNFQTASEILDKAGWVMQNGQRQKNNQPLGLTITTSESPSNMKAAQSLQKQWQNLGIQVNIDIKPSKQLMDDVIKPRKFQVLIFSQKFGADPDPFFFWHSSQSKDPGLNLTGVSDANLDKLLTEARNTTNSENRNIKYAQISQIINSKNSVILLNQTDYFYFINPKVQNINIQNLHDVSARFYDLPNWYLETKRVWK